MDVVGLEQGGGPGRDLPHLGGTALFEAERREVEGDESRVVAKPAVEESVSGAPESFVRRSRLAQAPGDPALQPSPPQAEGTIRMSAVQGIGRRQQPAGLRVLARLAQVPGEVVVGDEVKLRHGLGVGCIERGARHRHRLFWLLRAVCDFGPIEPNAHDHPGVGADRGEELLGQVEACSGFGPATLVLGQGGGEARHLGAQEFVGRAFEKAHCVGHHPLGLAQVADDPQGVGLVGAGLGEALAAERHAVPLAGQPSGDLDGQLRRLQRLRGRVVNPRAPGR